ncbi:MAG: hypothetical protein IJO63_02610 [Bacilli bacterium]|nr:hypothetical protein [Bacilli bacterium]
MKEESANSLKQLYFIIVGLVVVIVGLVGYIVCDKILDDKVGQNSTNEVIDKEENKDDNNEVLNGDTEEDVENIPVPNPIVADLYNYYDMRTYETNIDAIRTINIFSDGIGWNRYKLLYSNDIKVIQTFFDAEDKLEMAREKLRPVAGGEEENYITKFLVSDLKAEYEKFFGSIDNVNFTNYSDNVLGECKIEGEYYVCKGGPGGTLAGPNALYMKYKGYDFSGEEIFIYQYVVFYDDTKYFKNYDWSSASNGYQNEIPDLVNKSKEEVFAKENLEKLSVYKQTYKKNDKGNYYLYSIEPVK